MQNEHPNILENFSELENLAKGRLVTLFLDYDGTLTPIVNNPDHAYLPDDTRKAIRQLAMLFPIAIISGRGRSKVEEFVQLSELYYAGSHGMDIAPPKSCSNTSLEFKPAAKFESLIQTVTEKLQDATRHINGSSIENNKYCVSVHFRNCHPDSYTEILNSVERIVAEEPELHMTRGRKVLEVRPSVDWDKGSALVHLLAMLGISEEDVFCIYIGDDRTDEDAFKVLSDRSIGAGILVSSKMKDTRGMWTVRDPEQVAQLLEKLVQYGNSGMFFKDLVVLDSLHQHMVSWSRI
jgi:trehalose 6-phosphate phosphatase